VRRRTVVHMAVLLSACPAIPPSTLYAQCPDGSPPPCARSAAPRVAIDPNAVAILPFRVSGPPEAQYLREGMLDLLNVALDGFAGWRVIQPRVLLRQIGTEAAPLDVARAAGLARQAGAATFILGNVVALGPELRVQAELYESAHGASLASVRARGTLALPAPVADSIAGGLARQRLALQSGVTRRALEEYTTTSPVALQEYLIGEQLSRRALWQEAAESLAVAIDHDSTFVLAYYGLYRATTWGNSGIPLHQGSGPAVSTYSIDDVVQRALRHLDRAPPRQRRFFEFLFATNRADALRLADGLIRDYPDDPDAWLERGDAYFHVGLESGESPAIPLESLQRAIALDPQAPEAYLHVAQLLSMRGDSAGAWQTLDRLRAMAPTWNATIGMDLAMRAWWRGTPPESLPAPSPEVAPNVSRYLLLIGDREPARAVALADAFAALAAGPAHGPADRVTALLRRHFLLIAQGRYAAAWDQLRQAAVLDPAGQEVLGATVMHQLVTGTHSVEAADAARRLAASPGAMPLWGTSVLAWRAAAVGPPDSAAATVRRLLSTGEYPTFRATLGDGLLGLVALRAGDTITAHRALAGANAAWIETRNIERFFPGPALALAAARLDIQTGNLDAAGRHLFECNGQVGVMFRAAAEALRGQIAELRGDTASAIRAYSNFIDLWKDADPQLQPRVQAARTTVERLRRRDP
jgi:tetratricopeptide (TPR) repeat protein